MLIFKESTVCIISRTVTFQKSWFYLLQWKLFKIMSNVFISSQKLFSFLRYLDFRPEFLIHAGKRLDERAKANFKLYDITDWETNNYNKHIAQHLKKCWQPESEICQLIEYNMRNIFLENHTQGVVEKLIPDALMKKLKLSISLDQHFSMLYSLFKSKASSTKIYKWSIDHLLLPQIMLS